MTKVFSAWADLMYNFLKSVATEQVPYEDLSAWIEANAPTIFQKEQAIYFKSVIAQYMADIDKNPPPVRIDLAYEQIKVGFEKLYEKLTLKFPELTESSKESFDDFLKLSLSETFHPVIATRAVITANMIKSAEKDAIKNLNNTVAAFQLVANGAQSYEEENALNPWTDRLQTFLSYIETESVSYDSLMEWMSTIGVKIFRETQEEYLKANKEKYLRNVTTVPPQVHLDVECDKIAFALDATYQKLLNQFPTLANERDKLALLKKGCLSDKYFPYLAARAVINQQLVKNFELSSKDASYFVSEALHFLEAASMSQIESINEYRPKVQPAVDRRASSPTMHRMPEPAKPKDETPSVQNRKTFG